MVLDHFNGYRRHRSRAGAALVDAADLVTEVLPHLERQLRRDSSDCAHRTQTPSSRCGNLSRRAVSQIQSHDIAAAARTSIGFDAPQCGQTTSSGTRLNLPAA